MRKPFREPDVPVFAPGMSSARSSSSTYWDAAMKRFGFTFQRIPIYNISSGFPVIAMMRRLIPARSRTYANGFQKSSLMRSSKS